MSAFAVFVHLAYVAAAAVVTLWLVAVPRARGEREARLLAAMLFFGGVAAVPLALAIRLHGLAPPEGPWRLAHAALYLALGTAVVCSALLTRAVFYPGSRAALALATSCGGFFALCAATVAFLPMSGPTLGLALLHFPVQAAVFGWGTFEALRAGRLLRRAPGADALAARRFLRFGLALACVPVWDACAFLGLVEPRLAALGPCLGIAGLVALRAALSPLPASLAADLDDFATRGLAPAAGGGCPQP